jgi:EmrB/QacA subfamily drug resistance transporter
MHDERHRYVILVIVLVGVLMSVLDGIVVSIALPTITGAFHAELSVSQWTITAYLVTLTSLLLVFGRVAERTGRVVLFIAGLAVFTGGSLACGLSATLAQLIVFRILQAVGGAMVFSISGAILFLAFPPAERGRAMGYLGSTVAIGSILGPIVGGLLVDTLGWRSIFLVNLPIGAVVVVGALLFLREGETRREDSRMDWPGAGALVGALLFLMLFLSGLGQSPVSAARESAFAAAAIVAVGAFLLRESRCERPLLDLAMLRTRSFLLPLVAMTLFFVASFMINVVGPFYFEGVMGFRPTQVGLLFLVVPMVMVVASPVAGWLYDRRRWRHYGTIGIAVVAVCYLALGILARSWYDVAAMAGIFVALGLGSALFQSPNSTEVMNALPRGQTAVASSVSAAARNLGMTVGVAVASLLLPLQVRLSGFAGVDLLLAPKQTLASAVGNVMVLSGCLAALSAVVLLRDRPEIRGCT